MYWQQVQSSSGKVGFIPGLFCFRPWPFCSRPRLFVFGKTRFDGTADGDFQLNAHPVEAALIWQPRFTNSFVGNVSAAYQHGHDRDLCREPQHGMSSSSAGDGAFHG